MNQKETTRQVRLAQAGSVKAFNGIVRQFQDMATGYAASVLGDFQSAQDAAQDAFVEAYLTLPVLRSPEAFPSWLRKIVFKHCDRQTRRPRVSTLPIMAAEHIPSAGPGLEEMVERQEEQEAISRAIRSLPPAQREVVALFYLGQYSQQNIADFLGLSLTTVKSRLHQGRSRLRERITQMEKTNWQAHPSRDEAFVARVNKDIALALAALAADTEAPSYDYPHPMYQLMSGLMGSLLLWAVEVKASEIFLVPASDQVMIRFTLNGVQERVMALPKSLQEPLTLRFKTAGDMEIKYAEEPQEGAIPVLHRKTLYEAVITVCGTKEGEQVGIVLAAIPKPQ